MKLRSGFEYVYQPPAHSARFQVRRRSVEWRRFVKSHHRALTSLFSGGARAQCIVPELTRFMIKYTRSGSKAHWTREWATQSLAQRFSSSSEEAAPQKQLPSLEGGPHYEGSTFDASVPKSGLLEFISLGGSLVPYRHLGFEVDDDEWMLDDQDPFLLPDRSALARGQRCRVPCYCRVHTPALFGKFGDCVACENYSVVTATESSRREWSYMLSGFDSHAAYCKSKRARRYRVLKRWNEEWVPGGGEWVCSGEGQPVLRREFFY